MDVYERIVYWEAIAVGSSLDRSGADAISLLFLPIGELRFIFNRMSHPRTTIVIDAQNLRIDTTHQTE